MRKPFLLLACALLLTGCGDEENIFSNHHARFVFQQCSAVPQLRAALGGSPGSFCSVYQDADHYFFESNDNLGNVCTYMKNAADQRLTPVFIAGIIVGTPVLEQQLVAYDLACPNCYTQWIIRRLSFSKTDRTLLECSRCGCKYSMQTPLGLLVEGESTARTLFRYHAQYDGMNQLTVTN